MNTLTIILQILEALASAVTKLAPLVAQGKDVVSETDAKAVHATLQKIEASTALLRPSVDAALEAASQH